MQLGRKIKGRVIGGGAETMEGEEYVTLRERSGKWMRGEITERGAPPGGDREEKVLWGKLRRGSQRKKKIVKYRK